jgi:hypothetical protein
MPEFEQIIAAGFTQGETDEMTIRVFGDPGTWTAPRVASLTRSLYLDAILTVRAAEAGGQG